MSDTFRRFYPETFKNVGIEKNKQGIYYSMNYYAIIKGMKFQEKTEAINLRKRGCSYTSILKKIRVSKGTLSVWLRDIELSASQKKKLLKGREISRYAGAKALQRKRIEKTEKIKKEAKNELAGLIKKFSTLFLPGLMLYWAEGAKSNETIKFSNSDPSMIIFMMKWFREVCGVKEKKFRIAVHIHELHCRKDIEKYWSGLTGIPLEQFQKTFIKPTSLGQRKNILYNGTCYICVYNKDLFRRMQGWKLGFLQENGIVNTF